MGERSEPFVKVSELSDDFVGAGERSEPVCEFGGCRNYLEFQMIL